MGIEPLSSSMFDDTLPHVVYDLGIDNLMERRQKAKQFDSAREVAIHLGVTMKKVFNNRAPETRIHSPFYNRDFAVRVARAKA